jgi:hypothetical protein
MPVSRNATPRRLNFAVWSELDRVGEQMHQDLVQTQRIAKRQAGQRLPHGQNQTNPSGLSLRIHLNHYRLEQFLDVEDRLLEPQVAGHQLRELQHRAELFERLFGTRPGRQDVVPLVSVEMGL